MSTRVRLDKFDSHKGFDRGRGIFTMSTWYLLKIIFFLSPIPWPYRIKIFLLKIFGAKIGKNVIIKPRVNIHLPWKLAIGDFSWIGEEVIILNFEPIEIGNQVCISQRVFLCAGNHDFGDIAMSYRNSPITVKDGAWIGAQCFVSPGIIIEKEAVIVAGSCVYKNQPAGMICAGNPCNPIKPRWKE